MSAVAGSVQTSDVAFKAVNSYAIASQIETNIITTTSTSYVDMDLITPYFNLQLGDKVLIFAKASVWCTQNGRSTDGRIRHETPGGNYYSGLETRHTSATGGSTGQIVLMEIFEPTQAGEHRWAMQWKSTQTGGYYSGSGTRVFEVVVLRGG